jgi:hypothetical protein
LLDQLDVRAGLDRWQRALETPFAWRSLLVAAGSAIGLTVLLASWVGVRAYHARSHLLEVHTDVQRLQDQVAEGRTDQLRLGLDVIVDNTAAAKRLTSDPGWRLASHVPLIGHSLRATSGLTAATDQLARSTLAPLVDAALELDPAQVRRPDGSIDLTRISAAAPKLAAAQTGLLDARADLAKVSERGVLPSIAEARTELVGGLGSLSGSLDAATRASRVVPGLLGGSGVRRYLVLFQNPAEARGTGGLPGSYAILRADHGKLTREQTGSDTELRDATAPVADLGPEFRARWGRAGGDFSWKAANLTPHFPWAAQVWAQLWQRQSGQVIDGVLSVDPVALGYLSKVTGPVRLSDGEVLSSDELADWAMSGEYFKYPDDNKMRKKVLVELARAGFDRVNAGAGKSAELLRALGQSAGERRLLFWSAHPEEESAIIGTPLAGAPLDVAGPYAGLVLNNAGGNKLDYYVDRRLSYDVVSCRGDRRTVRVTVRLKNGAPRSGLPGIVAVRSDHRPAPVGQSRTYVELYGTPGAHLIATRTDGGAAPLVTGTERGHPVWQIDLEIPPGAFRTAEFDIDEPATHAPVTIPIQPLARPMKVGVSNGCS